MDHEAFWSIIDESRAQGRGAIDRQTKALEQILTARPLDDVVAFQHLFGELEVQLYRWDTWAAAYVLLGGCSDDGFIDFRYWVISRGRDAVHAATTDPDALAQFITDPTNRDNGSAEIFGYVAADVYKRRTGTQITYGSTRHPAHPVGEDWDEDFEVLDPRFPRLAAVREARIASRFPK